MTDELLRSALYDKHVALEASMGDVAGWEMPLSYGGAIDEARRVGGRAGIFDAGHLGRIRIRGDGALGLLQRVCTHDVGHQEDNTLAPTLLLNDRGGILDLARLVRLEESWLLVTSPVNRIKILEHLSPLADSIDAKVDDRTTKECSLLVAGPQAAGLLDGALENVMSEKASDLGVGAVISGSHLLAKYVVARTDELGMWSVQVVLSGLIVGQAWRYITEKAGERCIAPAGLTAWDVLRMEAGLPMYGHEINESFDPYLAGLGGLVDLGHDFIGAEACRKLAARAPSRKLMGAVLAEDPTGNAGQASAGHFIPRQGTAVLDSHGDEIGTVTSGTYSPRLDRAIGLAYVTTSSAVIGLQVSIEQNGAKHSGAIVGLPFVAR